MINKDETKAGNVLVYQTAPMANKHFVMAVDSDLIRMAKNPYTVTSVVLFSNVWDRGHIKNFNKSFLTHSTIMEAALYEENGV